MNRKRKSKPKTQLPKTQAPEPEWTTQHPHAAGLDIGAREIWVAVPADHDPEPIRAFGTFTPDLKRLADWLAACGVTSVATPAPTAGAVWRVPGCTGSRSSSCWKSGGLKSIW